MNQSTQNQFSGKFLNVFKLCFETFCVSNCWSVISCCSGFQALGNATQPLDSVFGPKRFDGRYFADFGFLWFILRYSSNWREIYTAQQECQQTFANFSVIFFVETILVEFPGSVTTFDIYRIYIYKSRMQLWLNSLGWGGMDIQIVFYNFCQDCKLLRDFDDWSWSTELKCWSRVIFSMVTGACCC